MMSYSRWSNSPWYSFYNVNGKLSLWYDLEHTIDWDYDELAEIMNAEIMKQDPEKIPLFFKGVYTCSIDEANEAIGYIKKFMEEYDPEDKVRYEQEVEQLLAKWEDMENDKSSD